MILMSLLNLYKKGMRQLKNNYKQVAIYEYVYVDIKFSK